LKTLAPEDLPETHPDPLARAETQHRPEDAHLTMTLTRSQLELVVGLFVLVGISAVAYLAVEIGAGTLVGSDTYTLKARFTNVGGLNRGANVVIAGVTVGKVEDISLDEAYRAIITLRLRRNVELPVDSMASVRTSGLIGDKFISFTPGVEEEFLKPGELVTQTEPTVDIESLISRFAFGSMDKETPPEPAKE
jgi:phospholipid/cholesterol/gamma-HCH transport system substrate-binding protein